MRPYRPPSSTLPDYEKLTSAGWGFNASVGKHVTARMTISYMFDEIPDKTPSRFAAYLQVVASFF